VISSFKSQQTWIRLTLGSWIPLNSPRVRISVFCSEFGIHYWNCIACSEVGIRCQSCIVCSKFVIRCRNGVDCSELTFAAALCVLQRIWDSLPKLYCLQQICNSLPNCVSQRSGDSLPKLYCPAAKLRFAAEVVLAAANSHSLPNCVCCSEFLIRCRIVYPAAKLGFPTKVVLYAPNLKFASENELIATN
jgi:hypothetical protein